MRNYNYYMGLMFGNTPIPDVSKWTYQVGDLDTSGSRDATGLLHRARVATKINYEFSWNSLEWQMLQLILRAVSPDKFTITAPDPRTFRGTYTGQYYVGDRTGEAQYFLPDGQGGTQEAPGGRPEQASYSLKLKLIEY